MTRADEPLTVGQCAVLACLIEAAVPKPGNVHRGADFDDLTFYDFQTAAVAVGPAMQRAATDGRVGAAVLEAVRATRRLASTNVNLGIALLLAPLAAATRDASLREGVKGVLARLDADDARQVYEAIRLAQPGGLGRVDEADVAGPAPDDLLAAMRLAADRDSIARQYAEGFADVFDRVVPELKSGLDRGLPLAEAVVRTHLKTMRDVPDTLIARKCGLDRARQAGAQAGHVLDCEAQGEEAYRAALADFDFDLRSDGRRLNPGATADLIAAGLFAALHDRMIRLPIRF